MDAIYIRESNSHYLVIPVTDLAKGDYQIPMLLQNRIPGLLPVHAQTIDGVSSLYYEVTLFRSLSDCFEAEKMNLGMILKLLLYMSHIAEEIDRYLLRGNGIVLDPAYIFVSTTQDEICFCYNPCCNRTISDNLNCIARFILDHIDYEDRTCTALAYSLFQESMKESVSVADFSRMAVGYEAKEGFYEIKTEPPKKKAEDEKLDLDITEADDEEIEESDKEETSVGRKRKKTKAFISGKKFIFSSEKKIAIVEMMLLGALNSGLLMLILWGIGMLRDYWIPGSIEMIIFSVGGVIATGVLAVLIEKCIIKGIAAFLS